MLASSTATTDLGDYKNEYMLALHITEDGTKVHRIEEFMGSKNSTDFLQRLRGA